MSSGVLSDKKYRAWLKSAECKSRGESGGGAATGLSDVLPDMSCSAGWRSCGAINFEEISTRAAGRASPQASPTNILLLYFSKTMFDSSRVQLRHLPAPSLPIVEFTGLEGQKMVGRDPVEAVLRCALCRLEV